MHRLYICYHHQCLREYELFPLLQNYEAEDAPQLPYGYPVMTTMALMPNVWRRVMNPRVKAWRVQFYPDIQDWLPYNKASNPMPKGAP